MSTAQSAVFQSAASRLHLMTLDLLASKVIEEHDLVATNALYKSLCKKSGTRSCHRCDAPLLNCPELIQDGPIE